MADRRSNESVDQYALRKLKERSRAIEEDLVMKGIRKKIARKRAKNFAKRGLFRSEVYKEMGF